MHTHYPFLTTENYKCLPPETSQNCMSSLTGKFVGFQGCTANSPVPPFFLFGVNNTGHVPRCLELDSSYITTFYSQIGSGPFHWKGFDSLPTHIQNAIPRIRIPHHRASSWCIKLLPPRHKAGLHGLFTPPLPRSHYTEFRAERHTDKW